VSSNRANSIIIVDPERVHRTSLDKAAAATSGDVTKQSACQAVSMALFTATDGVI